MNNIDKILRAKKGDDNAFYELMEERKEALYKTAYIYVKNKEDALDIVSDTVYRTYVNIKKLKEPEFFNTYVTRILINCAMDFNKKQKRIVYIGEDPVEPRENYEKVDMERNIDLYNAIDKLQDKYKTVIILKYLKDMTLPEIAEVMQCPLGTIKTYLHRALLKLKLEVEEDIV